MEDPTVYEGSKLAMRSNLKVFSLPPTDVSVNSTFYGTYTTTTSLKDTFSPITFQIPASVDYTDLQSSFLYIRARVTQKDGSILASDDKVAISSQFFYTMFSNVKVKMNGTPVSDSGSLYPYRACIPELLCRGVGEKQSTMTTTMFYPDTITDNFSASNLGFAKRSEFCKSSKMFDLTGRISAPCFESSRYFVPGVSFEIIMTRSLPEFCLDSPTTTKSAVSGVPYDFTIESITLYVKYHKASQDVVKEHAAIFAKHKKAKYPMREVECKSTQIANGALSFTSDSYFSKMPLYLVLGLVSGKSYNGALDKTPMNFQNYSITSVTVRCENDMIMARTIEGDFDSGNYLLYYQSILEALGQRSTGNNLDRETYLQGNNLLLFSLVPTNTSDEFMVEKQGRIKVSIIFTSFLI